MFSCPLRATWSQRWVSKWFGSLKIVSNLPFPAQTPLAHWRSFCCPKLVSVCRQSFIRLHLQLDELKAFSFTECNSLNLLSFLFCSAGFSPPSFSALTETCRAKQPDSHWSTFMIFLSLVEQQQISECEFWQSAQNVFILICSHYIFSLF